MTKEGRAGRLCPRRGRARRGTTIARGEGCREVKA